MIRRLPIVEPNNDLLNSFISLLLFESPKSAVQLLNAVYKDDSNYLKSFCNLNNSQQGEFLILFKDRVMKFTIS